MSASKNIEILSNLNDDPQNLEAEQTVLGSILLNNEIFDEISDVKDDYFYNPVNKKIFKIIKKSHVKNCSCFS